MFVLPAIALLAVGLQSQTTAIERPAPPSRIELPSGIAISAGDYLQHLYAAIGSARLRELLLDRALEQAATKVDLARASDSVAAALRDPDAHARRLRDERIAQQHRGDRGAYLAEVQSFGRTPAEDLWALRTEGLRQARIAALVQSARQPTEARLRRVFDEHYGVDGVRVSVRHVFQSFGAQRHKAREAGTAMSEAEIEETVRKRVAALMVLHGNGTPFYLLVARGSEDPLARTLALDPAQAKTAGAIEGYNFQHFGPEFADAVRAMQAGEVRGPVRTSHGYHIIALDTVTRTAFADVEPRLRDLLRAEPPSLAEQRELLERLAAEHGIDAALRR